AAAAASAERRMLVARHLCRARPGLSGVALDRAVDATFDSYARYWVDSFRLPQLTPEEVDFGFAVEGFRHIAEPIEQGQGVILVLPHLGGWEWAGFWLTQVVGLTVTVVVEPVEPPALFDFFAGFRRDLGMNIVPLGPSAGSEILRSLKEGHVVCLLSDRDILGDGVELEFFGETTTLPAGPATLALRTGTPLVPVGCYFDGRHGNHAIVQAPVPIERQGRLRADVARVTGDLARRLEGLIRLAPEQWHLQQPNWPSDYDALEAIGKPHPRPAVGPSARPDPGA
ncbi:MAG TPA: phosphatidylinositol mannoside acyltransferase, partial [Acidimicrobiales bacterium]